MKRETGDGSGVGWRVASGGGADGLDGIDGRGVERGSQEVTEDTEEDLKGVPKAVSALRSATAVQEGADEDEGQRKLALESA